MSETYEVALFSIKPSVGQQNPAGEVSYVGYKRIPATVNEAGRNNSAIMFPPSEQDEPVLVTHAAMLDSRGVVVAVRPVNRNSIQYRPKKK